MYIELIDLLRCPRPHEETWLVAAFTKMDGRFVLDGSLGCPICESSYVISAGVADLREGSPPAVVTTATEAEHAAATANQNEAAVRIAAMLGLARPDSLIALVGAEAAHAHSISQLAECRVIAIDPSARIVDTERVATVLCDARIPLPRSSLDGLAVGRGIQLDDSELSRVIKPGGRLVLPASARVPAQFQELARDESHAVAECVGPLVTISR